MINFKKKPRIIFLGIIAIVIIVLIVLPTIIKNYAINNSKELAGRQIDIGNLKVNYFTGTLKLIDFKMFEQDEQTEFVSFDTLIVDTEIYRYFINEKVLEKLYLKGLLVNTVQIDSTFNFDDLVAFHKAGIDSTEVDDGEPFKYFLSNLELKDANFIHNDKNIDNITHIEDFSFLIPFIGWNQEEKSNADLKFNLKKGGYIESSLNVNPVDGEFDATITVSDLYLDAFYKYVVEYANINSFNGNLHSQILIQGNINDALKSIVSGKVAVNNFEMTDYQGNKFISAKHIGTNIKKIDYANNSYVIDSIKINESYTFFQLDSVTNNFFEIFKLNETEAESTTTSTITDSTEVVSNPSNLYYAINHLNVNNGVLDYTDNLTGEKFDYHFSDIKIDSDSISSDSKWVNTGSDMLLNNRGTLHAEVGVNPIDGDFDAAVVVSDLPINDFYAYLVEYANINSFKGNLHSNINIKGNIEDPVKSIVSGKVSLNDFEMTDNKDKKFLSSKKIDANLQKIDFANSSYVLNSLNIEESYTYFQLDSITNNFLEIFKLNESDEESISNGAINDSTQVVSSTVDLYYAIKKLDVNNGVLDYTDNLTGQKFDYHLSEIQVDSEGIFSDSEWIDIYSDMILNNRGTLNAKIGVNPSDTNNADIDITIEKFLLSDINIYSNHYMGHDILEGDFYYNTKTKIINGDITSKNQLLVKNVAVSSNEKGLYKLPLKFALFLLKDKNGDVNLDVPVRCDLNDPSVSVGKIVWNTFKNLIVKTVASPVNFLAGLVDGDPKELEEIEFAYHDTIPSGKPQRQLDKLIELEVKKEGLKIEMFHYVDIDLQKEAIAMAELGSEFYIETQKDYLEDEKDFETFLFAKVGNDSITVKEAIVQLNVNTNLDSLVTSYNSRLLKNTEAYLLEKNPFTKIKVLVADPKEPEHTGSKSKFKMKYDMLDIESKTEDSSLNKN